MDSQIKLHPEQTKCPRSLVIISKNNVARGYFHPQNHAQAQNESIIVLRFSKLHPLASFCSDP